MLSFAGRLTLCKSVIQALPTYAMQAAWIPRSICDLIDKRCRDFLWGDIGSNSHIHLVNWVKVCRPKAWGGLGLRSARNINQASLMKAGWHLLDRRKDLWVEVIKAKYKCGSSLVPCVQKKRAGSNFWRGICHTWDKLQENVCWQVGNGSTVNIWNDRWLVGCGKLSDLTFTSPSESQAGLHVADLVDVQGN